MTPRPKPPKPVVTKIEGPNGEPVNVTRCWQAILRPSAITLSNPVTGETKVRVRVGGDAA